jgi:tRNA A-37 threonylcarbamoyl transferase component Bud32
MEVALESISELGLTCVRLDYSYDNDSPQLDAFVERLSIAGVSLLLHLVQPLNEAQKMPEAEALERWRAFVESTLDRFAGRIEAVEAGSVVNRARWSGYRLSGFLAAWTVVHEIVRRWGLTLIGPNVTDFEPQYNAGLLGLFARRNLLPDVQSNNMFSERTIEPEALDHKIVGHWGKRIFAYNLTKKIRLVAAIGKPLDVRRHWSTCAFWTLPRIERILTDSEAKMADYLSRYFILCAASGDFERFYWGPMVSRREGLLDDGTGILAEPGRRDVVAFYRELPGMPEAWRVRPAFHALKTLVQWISGSLYLGPAVNRQTLQIHAFEKGDVVFHAAWALNGRIADLADCYDCRALSQVTDVFLQSGERLGAPPKTLGESPVFFVWPKDAAPEVRPDANVLAETIVAHSLGGAAYYPVNDGPWRGLIRANSEAEADRIFDALHPDRITVQPERHFLRKARNAIWTVQDPRAENGGVLVVKQPLRIALHKRLLDRAKPSKALRSWNGTCELLRRGIASPKPVAYIEHIDRREMLRNWYVCEHVEGRHSVRSFFARYASGEAEVEGIRFDAFTEMLVKFVRNMHDRGVFFRDFSGGNVLVRTSEGNRIDFSLIDTARARFSNRRFSHGKQVSDLKRLVHKLNPKQQQYFMNVYLQDEGRSFSLGQRFAFTAYAVKARLKRIKRRVRKRLVATKK